MQIKDVGTRLVNKTFNKNNLTVESPEVYSSSQLVLFTLDFDRLSVKVAKTKINDDILQATLELRQCILDLMEVHDKCSNCASEAKNDLLISHITKTYCEVNRAVRNNLLSHPFYRTEIITKLNTAQELVRVYGIQLRRDSKFMKGTCIYENSRNYNRLKGFKPKGFIESGRRELSF